MVGSFQGSSEMKNEMNIVWKGIEDRYSKWKNKIKLREKLKYEKMGISWLIKRKIILENVSRKISQLNDYGDFEISIALIE